jgi:hypothetical protein
MNRMDEARLTDGAATINDCISRLSNDVPNLASIDEHSGNGDRIGGCVMLVSINGTHIRRRAVRSAAPVFDFGSEITTKAMLAVRRPTRNRISDTDSHALEDVRFNLLRLNLQTFVG